MALVWPGMGATLRAMHVYQLGLGSHTRRFWHATDAVYYVSEASVRLVTESPDGVVVDHVPIAGAMVHLRSGTVLRYLVAYEIGVAVNPTLVEGQILGGAVQGIGGALLEEFRYDESGQPQATTFMDYLMPTVAETPDIETLITEDIPSESNPLGVKGGGEGGTTAAGAVISCAVADALGRPGRIDRLPMTPNRIREMLADARGTRVTTTAGDLGQTN